jgi:hypothetical protein
VQDDFRFAGKTLIVQPFYNLSLCEEGIEATVPVKSGLSQHWGAFIKRSFLARPQNPLLDAAINPVQTQVVVERLCHQTLTEYGTGGSGIPTAQSRVLKLVFYLATIQEP